MTPAASGNLTSFPETTYLALSGAHSLRFDPDAPIPFRSFTYDLPIAIETGTITLWFYDTIGAGTGSTFEWRLSILLEDANNPTDFGAVEIADLPYGGLSYYGSEGAMDRLLAPDPSAGSSLDIHSESPPPSAPRSWPSSSSPH